MQARNFLVLWGLGLGICTSSCETWSGSKVTSPLGLVAHLRALNDAGIPRQLARQQCDRTKPHYGGIRGTHDLYHPGVASSFIRNLAAAYISPQSRYAGDPALLSAMDDAVEFMLGGQHSDGTIDLLTTNFHSTPDTGFILEWMCSTAGVLRAADEPSVAVLLDKILRFIRRGAEALTIGGIHTPNHRWVVCMALARTNVLIPDPRYVARIDAWLAEQIDIDPDGQFTERSTSVYSPLTDRCLITVARLLDRPELLEPVRRNLEMSLHYMHADGEVVTDGSRRQDQHRRSSMVRYYYAYRYMAQHDRNGRFAAVVRHLEATQLARLAGQLIYFLESPALANPLPPCTDLPTDFERHFAHSDLVRIRRGDLSATILADNPSFFSLHIGEAAMVLRFASAFFGKGQFVGGNLHKEGDSWVLSQDLEGPYYQPIAAAHRRADGDWHKMSRELRPTSEVQKLQSIVRITERPDGIDVEIEITGTDGVPVAIELGCRPDDLVSGATQLSEGSSSWLLPHGRVRVVAGRDQIEVGDGHTAHRWTQLRGALPKLGGKSIYVTGFTPYRRTLEFRR